MRTSKIIIYPLMLILLFPVTAFAAELPETVAAEKQEEIPVENVAPEVPSQMEPEQEPEKPAEVPSQPEPEIQTEPEITVPETMPQEPEIETETVTETQTEIETESQTETETEQPQETVLDEDTKGLLKEYLTNAVSGNTVETPSEPENTEYQEYVKQVLRVLQDNSTTQMNVEIVLFATVSLLVGLFVAYLMMRRFL